MEKKKIFLLIAALVLFGCDNKFQPQDLHGLWELKEVNVDALDKNFKPTLLHLRPNKTYAVSMVSGDFSGIYELTDKKLLFTTGEHPWFRTNWLVNYFPDDVTLEGTEIPYTVTKLRWQKISEVPDYRSFEEKVLGTWQLYKIRTKRETEALINTTFTVEASGQYIIAEGDKVLDRGPAFVNTRHHKIVFVRDSIQWDAWFYGRELRLQNDAMDIQYSLRRPAAMTETQ